MTMCWCMWTSKDHHNCIHHYDTPNTCSPFLLTVTLQSLCVIHYIFPLPHLHYITAFFLSSFFKTYTLSYNLPFPFNPSSFPHFPCFFSLNFTFIYIPLPITILLIGIFIGRQLVRVIYLKSQGLQLTCDSYKHESHTSNTLSCSSRTVKFMKILRNLNICELHNPEYVCARLVKNHIIKQKCKEEQHNKGGHKHLLMLQGISNFFLVNFQWF